MYFIYEYVILLTREMVTRRYSLVGSLCLSLTLSAQPNYPTPGSPTLSRCYEDSIRQNGKSSGPQEPLRNETFEIPEDLAVSQVPPAYLPTVLPRKK